MSPSENVASRLYDVANAGLILGLVIGVISTILVVWMGNVKEQYLKIDLANAEKTAAEALKQQEILKADNLRLEALIQPRSFTLDQQRDIANALLSFKGRHVVLYVASLNDPESHNFSQQLLAALKAAGLNLMFSEGAPNGRQYSAITETGVQIKWAPGQQDLAIAIERALVTIGHVRRVSVSPGTAPVSGPTELLNHSVFVSIFPKPFEVLQP